MSEKTTDQLRADVRALRAKRDASTDQAERASLLAEMNRIENEITERSLDAGKDALNKAKGIEGRLDQVRTDQPHDAVSSLVRTGKKLGGAGGQGGGGNG